MQPGAAGGSGTGSTMAPSGGSTTMGSSSTDTSSSSTMAQSGGQSGMQGQFMTQMQAEQVMASKLIGTTVVGANNESIGDVNDVILDRNGQVMAVVVGVGGFLGIGEKDVAVPFKSLEFASRNQASASNGGATGSNAGSNNVTSTGSTAGGAPTNRSTASTGNTGGNGASTSADSAMNTPDRIMLRMTKAELQSAPAFRASAAGGGGNNNSSNAGGASGTTAPKQ